MKAPISSTTLTAIVAAAKVVSAETEPRPKAARTPATKRIRPGSTRLYQPAGSEHLERSPARSPAERRTAPDGRECGQGRKAPIHSPDCAETATVSSGHLALTERRPKMAPEPAR